MASISPEIQGRACITKSPFTKEKVPGQEPPPPGAWNSLTWRMLFSPEKSLFLHKVPSDCPGTSGCGKDKLRQLFSTTTAEEQFRSNLRALSQPTLLYFRSLCDCLCWISHSRWWKLFRLAAQHIHRGPPSPLVTFLVHQVPAFIPPRASPTPLVSRVFFCYSCLISFAFLQKLLKSSVNTKFYLSPQMVKQNQISGTWLLNQHSRGYAAVPSVPTSVGHLWRPPPSRTTSRVWLLCLCQVLGEDVSIQQSSGKQCQHLAVASCSQPRPSCPRPADSYSSPMNTSGP